MLTSKQRAMLRGMANTIQPIFQIGKGGVTPVITEQVELALEARELIKLTVLENCEISAREVCDILCERIHAEGVQCIGRKIVIYKRSQKNHKIEI